MTLHTKAAPRDSASSSLYTQADIQPLESLKTFESLKPGQVVSWIEYYTGILPQLQWYEDETGHRSQQVDQQTLNALRACVGVDDVYT